MTKSQEENTKRLASINQIRDEILGMKGGLADERRANKVFPVIGEGDLCADLVFVGEAPGKNEAIKAKPFCGASGKFLDVMLESISLPRSSVYITSIVNDRPTDNRDPTPEEISTYSKFLDRQIEIIKPKVIATLGRISMVHIMNKFGLANELKTISNIHGKVFIVDAPWTDKNGKPTKLSIVPLYHPAVALYKGSNRSILLEDFKVLKSLI